MTGVCRLCGAPQHVPWFVLGRVPHGRWTAGRKAELLAAIRGGEMTVGEARERFNVSTEELTAWAGGRLYTDPRRPYYIAPT